MDEACERHRRVSWQRLGWSNNGTCGQHWVVARAAQRTVEQQHVAKGVGQWCTARLPAAHLQQRAQ